MAIDRLRERLSLLRTLPRDLVQIPREIAETRALLARELDRMFSILQLIYDDEPGNRRRLVELRRTAEYEAAFAEAEPLVTIVIPTYDSFESLAERAIPSVLAQSYSNLELVIVGDAAPPETAEVVASFRDPRIVYRNLPYRGPYPEDRFERWNVSGVPAYNAAVRLASGRWISPFSDDDALRPAALATVVDAARRGRHEVCYGALNCVLANGREERLGVFPPAPAGFGLQGAVYHSGLSFIEHELADALFGVPHDWGMVRRMLRAGVRFGYVDEILCDYYPTSNPRGDMDPALFERLHRDRPQDAVYER